MATKLESSHGQSMSGTRQQWTTNLKTVMKHQSVIKPKCRHDWDLSVASRPVIHFSSCTPKTSIHLKKSPEKSLVEYLNPEYRTLNEALDFSCLFQLCIGKPLTAVIPGKREKEQLLWQVVLAQLHWAEWPSLSAAWQWACSLLPILSILVFPKCRHCAQRDRPWRQVPYIC